MTVVHHLPHGPGGTATARIRVVDDEGIHCNTLTLAPEQMGNPVKMSPCFRQAFVQGLRFKAQLLIVDRMLGHESMGIAFIESLQARPASSDTL